MIKERLVAIKIMKEFELLLQKMNIFIPDATLENKITKIIHEEMKSEMLNEDKNEK